MLDLVGIGLGVLIVLLLLCLVIDEGSGLLDGLRRYQRAKRNHDQ